MKHRWEAGLTSAWLTTMPCVQRFQHWEPVQGSCLGAVWSGCLWSCSKLWLPSLTCGNGTPSSWSLLLSISSSTSPSFLFSVPSVLIKFSLGMISEKTMAPYSSTLAWKIPWTEEPGRLQSMGSLRVGHNWATSLSLFTFMHWRRKWQPTPVFLPGESQGRGSLVGCRV